MAIAISTCQPAVSPDPVDNRHLSYIEVFMFSHSSASAGYEKISSVPGVSCCKKKKKKKKVGWGDAVLGSIDRVPSMEYDFEDFYFRI
jgi:hypothetical protein